MFESNVPEGARRRRGLGERGSKDGRTTTQISGEELSGHARNGRQDEGNKGEGTGSRKHRNRDERMRKDRGGYLEAERG